MRRSRRSLLQSAGVVLSGTTAGCLSTSRRTPQQSPTETTAQPASLKLTAEVVRQSAADAPARVAATLSNDGTGTVRPGFGPTLLFSDSGPDEDLARADPLVLDPDGRGVLRSDPVQSSNDCWRYPEDGIDGVQSSLEYRALAPGDELREAYDIYTAAEASACLPQGRYNHQDNVELPGGSRTATLTLTLTIDERQRLTVSGDASAWTGERTES
ncbi:hypothetical protein NDI56_04135 [Haloarcula sp. S1CR25-12]|uniref:Lipoprotein n=1 Tax=Haloarcula saliterrae TaxID=2950534 RepID=A0ABU2F8J6_9EURY|nr:hypothetical protein [Haloarcula sp. S1CR25-12]MDS0258600.1 hypothetical protein [Haloarcula sp. S1CR25-12]